MTAQFSEKVFSMLKSRGTCRKKWIMVTDH